MLLTAAVALSRPEWLIPLNQGSVVVLILAFVMLCMGLTLTFEDFRRIIHIPKAVAVGFAAQYSIMPLLAWGIAHALNLPPHFAVGLILVGLLPRRYRLESGDLYRQSGCSPFSRDDRLFHIGTAIILTPILTQLFAGALVPVDTWMLFKQTLQVMILPVVLGCSAQPLGATPGEARDAGRVTAIWESA